MHDMSSDITMFEFLTFFNCKGNDTPVVKLGDDSTMLRIKGQG